MKKLYFSFVLFLFSSLFILSGCYTSFKIQERERESTYESVVADSDEAVIQNRVYNYNNLGFQSGWYPWYQYPFWRPNSYLYNPWTNLWIGVYWNSHGFGYWNYWRNYPYVYNYPYYWNQHSWWVTHEPPHIDNRFGRFRSRDIDGERGSGRPEVQKPRDQNPPGERTKERIRDERPPENQKPQVIPPRKNPNSERQRPTQVIPPRKDQNTDRQRKEPTRVTPQNDRTREKSSNENPTKSNTTRDRERK